MSAVSLRTRYQPNPVTEPWPGCLRVEQLSEYLRNVPPDYVLRCTSTGHLNHVTVAPAHKTVFLGWVTPQRKRKKIDHTRSASRELQVWLEGCENECIYTTATVLSVLAPACVDDWLEWATASSNVGHLLLRTCDRTEASLLASALLGAGAFFSVCTPA